MYLVALFHASDRTFGQHLLDSVSSRVRNWETGGVGATDKQNGGARNSSSIHDRLISPRFYPVPLATSRMTSFPTILPLPFHNRRSLEDLPSWAHERVAPHAFTAPPVLSTLHTNASAITLWLTESGKRTRKDLQIFPPLLPYQTSSKALLPRRSSSSSSTCLKQP